MHMGQSATRNWPVVAREAEQRPAMRKGFWISSAPNAATDGNWEALRFKYIYFDVYTTFYAQELPRREFEGSSWTPQAKIRNFRKSEVVERGVKTRADVQGGEAHKPEAQTDLQTPDCQPLCATPRDLGMPTPGIPTAASRRAGRNARGVNPDNVHGWWSRTGSEGEGDGNSSYLERRMTGPVGATSRRRCGRRRTQV
ncbi:hypothetical protein DFP72DRAFT_1052486 [Ephemerocybe angulata]|uniref:Uncharacterized protein n=1 Tax=Ephemerocybe angulata TaxID=980116 RepID=A0A8H6HD03_9AGAR|nr:hypothetical protein DFP72DRAFT_1052486 [Tulosesus angulatus]